MTGAYAHITLINILREPRTLEGIGGFPQKAIPAILDYFKFCELGAVSPDYPYLALGDSNAKKWADEMHYTRTGGMIHAGVKHLKSMQGEAKRKGLAWLLGYSAHVVTDVTIHPVVELKVGDYDNHKTEHRICEMHQDAHIFQQLNLGEIGLSEHLDSGIAACCNAEDKHKMDSDIETLWLSMLKDVHQKQFKTNMPDINKWHKGFKVMLDDVGEEGNKLIPFARHVAADLGLTYPSKENINKQYIENLKVPTGQKHYDEIFNKAINNVGSIWQLIASGVMSSDETYLAKIGTTWNLDTGRDERNQLVFWG